MRRFDDKTSWEGARSDVLFTLAALEASERHEKQLKAAQQQLTRWMPIEVARREAEDGITRANAKVSWCDYRLDRAVKRFANELLRDTEGERGDATFRRVFPEAPNEIIRLGLESEIERCETMFTVVAKLKLSKAATARFADVEAAMETGRGALTARRAAYTTQATVSIDIASWKQSTDAVRASIHVQLTAWALENNEDRDYADRFFPTSTAKRTKAKKPPKPDKGPGGGGDPK